MADQMTSDFKPPYVSFQMLDNTLERMRLEGMPQRVDRSYLGTASGSAKAQFIAAAKALELLNDELEPTGTLRALVQEPERRPEIIRELLLRHYKPVTELGTNATQAQLEEKFRSEYGISGSTIRKAITFYLAAAKFAGIDLSPHFAAPRTTGSPSGSRRRRSKQQAPATEPVVPRPDPLSDLKTRYVETLLEKFAASNGEVDTDLADRIERLVGFSAPSSPELDE